MKILLFVALGLVSLLLACGGSGHISTPPPTGSFSNASLMGQYAYSLSGIALVPSTTSTAPYTEAGVFTADGSGHITSGVDDFSQNGNFGSNPITGTYSISNDGTGSITINFASGGSIQLAITLVSASQFYLIESDTFANGGGSAEKQDTTAFAAAPSGTFAFRVHATGASANVGIMTIAGGRITSGSEDVLTSSGLTSPTLTSGTVNAPASNGRGTMSITNSNNTTSNFAYYVVNASTLRLMQTDAGVLALGRAEKQSGGPFTNGSVNGSFAFGSAGDTTASLSGVHSVGVFTSGGGGTISTGNYDSVQDGNQTTNVTLNGNYTMTSAGRGVVALNLTNGTSIQDIFWMVSPSRAFFLVNALGRFEDGTVDQQLTSSFSNASLNGQFAFVMDGFDSTSLVDRVGTLQADGNGNLSLNEALNRAGTVTIPGLLPGTYIVSSNGRVVGNISSLSSNLVFYMVSTTSGYSLQNDSSTEISGMIAHQ